MPNFIFICPKCRGQLQGDTQLVGQSINCPTCWVAIIVPSVAEGEGAPPMAVRVRSTRSRQTPLLVTALIVAAGLAVAGWFGLVKFQAHLRNPNSRAWVKLDEDNALPVPGWGHPGDPDADCNFYTQPDALMIKVPGSQTAHDLAADANQTNAPCVLQPATGDFTVQVCVDGQFTPGQKSTLPGRVAYNGAGLVVLADPRNVVTFARAVLQRTGQIPRAYVNFEIRIDGHLQRIGLPHDPPLPQTGPVYLRLQRHGSKITGAVSLDDRNWDDVGTKVMPDGWSDELQAGIIAISTSTAEFAPQFSDYKLSQ